MSERESERMNETAGNTSIESKPGDHLQDTNAVRSDRKNLKIVSERSGGPSEGRSSTIGRY